MIEVKSIENVSLISINQGKVNALDREMLINLEKALDVINQQHKTNVILLTGTGSFFSFGLDIPSFLDTPRDELKTSIQKLLKICKSLYLSDKITISSINGHATGAGCMLAISTDFRLMVNRRAKIALNEINIGLSLFSSTISMLRNLIGYNNAKRFLLTGNLISPEEALKNGLVDELHDKEELYGRSLELALSFKDKNNLVIKNMKRELLVDITNYLDDSDESIENFMNIFYLKETQEILRKIEVRK